MRTILNECFNVTTPVFESDEANNEVTHDIDELYGEVRKFHDLGAGDR